MIYFSGNARFVSVTYRLFKLPPGTKGEPTQVIYNGQISAYEKEFRFDHQHVFKVCILVLLNHRSARRGLGSVFQAVHSTASLSSLVPRRSVWMFLPRI